MRKILTVIAFVLFAICGSAQVNTYTTRIGEYNGPVKSVLLTNASGINYDLYNPDGTLQKNVSSQKDYYVILEWGESTITHKAYNRETDEPMGETVAKYKVEEASFTVGNDDATYFWTFNEEPSMNLLVDGKLIWSMKAVDKHPAGYTSVAYVNGEVSSRVKVDLYDPDEYGNFTRMIHTTEDGTEHESMLSYEYYSEEEL